MKKKIVSILLVLAMVFSMVPTVLAAAFVPQEVDVSGGSHFRKLTVTNIEKNPDGSLKITLTPDIQGSTISYHLGTTAWALDNLDPDGADFDNTPVEGEYLMADTAPSAGHIIQFTVPEADYKGSGTGITIAVATGVAVKVKSYSFSLDGNGDFLVPAGAAATSITAPAHEGSIQGLTEITATITPDGTNAVTDVRYLIQNSAGKYLSAADGTFGDTETWIEETFAAAAAGGAQTWTSAAISATFADGAYTLKVQAKDTAGYGTAATATFTVDNTAPSMSTITRKADAAELTNKAGGLEFAVTYSEAVKGVVAADFTASSGTVTAVTSNNGTPANDANWTVKVTGYSDGAVTLTEAATSATTDVAGNALAVNSTKKTASYTYDGTAPAISKVEANGTEIQGGSAIGVAPSGAMTITLTETNKKNTGAVSGIVLNNSGTVSNAKYNSDGTITFDYSGLPANTAITLTIPTTAVVDAAGNQMAAQATYSFTTADLAANDLKLKGTAPNSLIYGDTFELELEGGNGTAVTFTPTNGITKTAQDGLKATFKVTGHTGNGTVTATQAANATTSGATLTNVVNAALSPREVTLGTASITKPSKVYDGNNTATITGALTLGNTVSGDTVSLTGTLTGTYATTDANSSINVTLSGSSLDGADKAHYKLPGAAPVVTGEITKAELTSNMLNWSGVSFGDVTYDKTTAIAANKVTGTPAATGVTSFDTVTYTRADKNVNASVAVNAAITAITATNYKLPVGGLTVNGIGKTIKVTAAGVSYTYTGAAIAKAYDGTTAVPAADKSKLEAVAVTGAVSGDAVSIDAGAAVFASANVSGSIGITGLALKGNDKANYTLTTPTVTGAITAVKESVPTITVGAATKNTLTVTVTSGAKYAVTTSQTAPAAAGGYTETGSGAAQTISGLTPSSTYYIHAYMPASDANHTDSDKVKQSAATTEAGKVSVTFLGNGSNGGTMAAQQIAENSSAMLTQNTFTKTGYSFKGWATSQATADAGAVDHADKAQITVVEAGITLYAVWTANALTGVKPVAVAGAKDVAYTLAAPTFTGEDAVDGTAVNPAVTYAITAGNDKLTEYGLTFNTAAGTITGTPSKAGTITGITVTITGRNGVTTAPIVYDNIEVTTLPVLTVTAVADSISAYAGDTLTVSQFIKTVTGLENGDSIGSLFIGNVAQDTAVSRVKVTFYQSADNGVTWTKATALPNAAGTYWYTVSVEADGAFHNSYALAALSSTSDPTAATPTKDGVLTLSNRPSGGGGGSSTYRLTFETNGGSKISSINKSRNTEIELTQTPTKEGFVFDGWYKDKNLTEKVTSVKLTGNMTVYAKWSEDKKEETTEGLAFDREMTQGYIEGVKESSTGQMMFKPEAAMTRGEVAAILARTLINKMELGKTYDLSKFSDVSADAWYANYIGFLAELGVITGFGDGTCRPEQLITRAEFVTMVIRIDGMTTGENHFSDVATNHWAEQYIVAAAAKGYVDGYGDGTFGPTREIARAEAVKIMNAVLGWTGQTEAANPFSDVTESYWAYNEIVKAATGK